MLLTVQGPSRFFPWCGTSTPLRTSGTDLDIESFGVTRIFCQPRRPWTFLIYSGFDVQIKIVDTEERRGEKIYLDRLQLVKSNRSKPYYIHMYTAYLRV